jgi:hypothetical protein
MEAKIDNVKAKMPRLTMSRPRFKMRRTEDPGQDPHWQDIMLPTRRQ